MATYTKTQLLQYLRYIGYPGFQDASENVELPQPTLDTLTKLQPHHLASVPFENFRIHYDQRRIIVEPEVIFQKVVGDARGRGGHCTETNTLFTTVLRSLGFDVATLGGRVIQGKEPEVWGHMTSLVTVDSQRYLVDVGYGSATPPVPLPYTMDEVFDGVAPEQYKISEHVYPGMKLPMKVLYRRSSPDDEWVDEFGFCDAVEFQQPDYQMMSDRTTTQHPYFTENLMLVKFVLNDGKIIGKRTFHNHFGVRQRLTGQREPELIMLKFKSDAERIQAYENYFGLVLTEEEKKGIDKSPCKLDSSLT